MNFKDEMASSSSHFIYDNSIALLFLEVSKKEIITLNFILNSFIV